MAIVNSFRGDFAFLSNFYEVPVYYEGLIYSNSEAAFQAAKTLKTSIRESFTTLSGKEAKREGRNIPLRDDWEFSKTMIMYNVVRNKFSQNPILKKKLLDTGNIYLEEANHWGDDYWGTVNGRGQNMLGNILMAVRRELRSGQL